MEFPDCRILWNRDHPQLGRAVISGLRSAKVGLLTCGVVVMGLAGCGATSGAPPTVVCGRVLSRSEAGIEVYTIWGRGAHGVVRYPTVGNVMYVQVARGCSTGSEVQIRPAGLLRVVKSVRARDGRFVVVTSRMLV